MQNASRSSAKKKLARRHGLLTIAILKCWAKLPGLLFLRPDSQSSRVRRGRAFVDGSLQPYAQVARSKETFSSKLEKPAILDRPFLIQGQISDEDLIGIVTALRQTSWLDEHYILDMRRDPPLGWFGPYRVRANHVRGAVGVVAEHGSSFSILFLNVTNQVWEIVSAGGGVRQATRDVKRKSRSVTGRWRQAYAAEIIVDQSDWDPLLSEVARRDKPLRCCN